MKEDKFNPIMEESDDRTLCIRIEKPISTEGYEQNFLPRIKNMVGKYGEIRLLVYFKRYKGWEQGAAIDDIAATVEYGPLIRKVALVNPPEKEIVQHKMLKPLFKGDFRFFAEDDLQKAINWVKT